MKLVIKVLMVVINYKVGTLVDDHSCSLTLTLLYSCLSFAELRPQTPDENEEIIRCICGIFKDEGLMIQCEKCHVSIYFPDFCF